MGKFQEKLSSKKLLAIFLFLLVFFLLEICLLGFVLAKIKTRGKFNLLILGMGGAGHEALDLTDTIMVLMAEQKNKKILLVSLPRDIWIDPLKTKINTLYHYGGFKLVEKEVGEILGQPIDKSLLIDFKVFEEAIDSLGGIEVKVDRAFDDYYYPILGKENDDCGGDPKLSCRYEHLHFDEGWQRMSGERALKFVRSRHAEGEEGSDFARNRRQQKVIFAFKNKIFSPEILGNPKKLWHLWQTVGERIKTDIEQKDYLFLLKFFLSSWPNVRYESLLLDGGQEGKSFLYHPQSHPSGQWVLLPVGGSWGEIQKFVSQQLSSY